MTPGNAPDVIVLVTPTGLRVFRPLPGEPPQTLVDEFNEYVQAAGLGGYHAAVCPVSPSPVCLGSCVPAGEDALEDLRVLGYEREAAHWFAVSDDEHERPLSMTAALRRSAVLD